MKKWIFSAILSISFISLFWGEGLLACSCSGFQSMYFYANSGGKVARVKTISGNNRKVRVQLIESLSGNVKGAKFNISSDSDACESPLVTTVNEEWIVALSSEDPTRTTACRPNLIIDSNEQLSPIAWSNSVINGLDDINYQTFRAIIKGDQKLNYFGMSCNSHLRNRKNSNDDVSVLGLNLVKAEKFKTSSVRKVVDHAMDDQSFQTTISINQSIGNWGPYSTEMGFETINLDTQELVLDHFSVSKNSFWMDDSDITHYSVFPNQTLDFNIWCKPIYVLGNL